MSTRVTFAEAAGISLLALGASLVASCKEDGDAPAPAAPVAASAGPAATQPAAGKKASAARKAVTGAPSGVSTKPTGELPKPTTKIDAKIPAATAESAHTETACAVEEEGLAACLGSYAVFCQTSRLYALDCALFVDAADGETATCGEIDGEIDCGWED